MTYQCVATSVAGFIQQLAVCYVANGYYFYVTGRIPDNKDAASIDQKIIQQYGINVSKWTRARRKREGLANVQYLRYRDFFVIAATRGEHPFFTQEAKGIRDIRERPLYFWGYSIGCRQSRHDGGYHASVRIERGTCHEMKVYFEEIATAQSVENLCREFRQIDFVVYAPVRRQILRILRAVNRRRRVAGLELVPRHSVWLYRSPVRPFD